jgi:hypothetical protein
MIGTPYFMSPEQCGGQKVSPQSDQYSLGIMGFQLLTGELPFLADSMVGVIQHHYMTPVPDITQVRQDVPRELLDVIYCALNKAPEDRFATTKDMATALENVPLTDAQRAEAEEHLKLLSMGTAIPKVRTGTLPPLTLTISGPGPVVHHRPATTPRSRTAPAQAAPVKRKKKRNKKKVAIAASVLGAFVLTAGALGYSEISKQQAAAAKRRADSAAIAQRIADSTEAANRPSTVIFTGLPANGSVTFASKKWENGVPQTLKPVTDIATARAPGWTDWVQSITVRPGQTDTVVVSMEQVASVPTNAGNTRAAGPAAVETERVLIRVTPVRAAISMDERPLGVSGTYSGQVSIGNHTFKFETPGCETVTETRTVVKGRQNIILVTMPGCQ